MDVQTYNKVFLPQWTTASLFIRNLQPTLEDKCDKESLRQLQILGWNEKTKKFISDVLNLYKEKVVNELNSCNSYEPSNIKNCPICGKQSLSASNSYCRDHTNSDDTDKYHVDYNDVSNTPNRDYFDKKVEEALKENTMDNYIVINGKKAELTKEQLKALGIEIENKRNNPFNDKLKDQEEYFVITAEDVRTSLYDHITITDIQRLNNANSFNDKDFAKQVYLHELLNRKLLKCAWDNEAEDCEWDEKNEHYYIYLNAKDKVFAVNTAYIHKESTVYFSNMNIAEQAIENVVKPFIEEHPEFVW